MRTAIVLVTFVLTSTHALANCAEDLTRLQLAMPNATSDVQAGVRDLITQAVNRAKAQDEAGCESATVLALQLLGLPSLAPLELSTPLVKSQSGASSQSLSKPSAPNSVQPSAKPPTDAQATASPIVGPAPAQLPAPVQSDTPASQSASKAFYFSTRDIVGTAVKEAQNQNRILGRLEGFVVDPATAVIAYALVDQGGLFGFDTRHVAIPFGQMRFFGQWDAPAVDVTAERLTTAPPISDAQLEVQLNDPLWRQSVNDFWKPAGPSPEPTPVASAHGSQVPPPTTAQPASTPPSTAPPPAAAAGAVDPAHGKAIMGTVCAGCHTDTPNGGVRVGPDLYGVYGRPVASSPGYSYSRGLAGHKGSWDAAALDGFLKNPRADVPGTYMTFPGISSDRDRQDVIAYLKTLSVGASQ